MDRLAVGEQHDAERPVPGFTNGRPAPNPAIGLMGDPHRVADHALDPLLPNPAAIGSLHDEIEIGRALHATSLGRVPLPADQSDG